MDIQRSKRMNYRFAVQASNPRPLVAFDADDQSLSDAIQTVFPLEAEYGLIVWNWIYIPVTYKYDVSFMVDDIIELIDAMSSSSIGRRVIHWPSNTFAATWNIEWSDEIATIDAQWHSVIGDTESMLALRPKIVMPAAEFICEWKRLLETVAMALTNAGYSSEHLAGLRQLKGLIAKLHRDGILYRSE
jgi:hypothetical protein